MVAARCLISGCTIRSNRITSFFLTHRINLTVMVRFFLCLICGRLFLLRNMRTSGENYPFVKIKLWIRGGADMPLALRAVRGALTVRSGNEDGFFVAAALAGFISCSCN